MPPSTPAQLAQQVHTLAAICVPGALILNLFWLLVTSERNAQREKQLRQAGQAEIARLQDKLYQSHQAHARTIRARPRHIIVIESNRRAGRPSATRWPS